MGHAAIFIEDDDTLVKGGIAVRMETTGGPFDRNCHAHVIAYKLVQSLNQDPNLVAHQEVEKTFPEPEGLITQEHPGYFPGICLP